MTKISVRVVRKQVEALDVCSYELWAADGSALPEFSAGAHIDVHMPNEWVRQYSLCNAAQQRDRYVIAVLRDPKSRGGSAAMHECVQEGDLLQISEPKNHFPLLPAKNTLLLAGGIGITPMISMAEELNAQGAAFELHYVSRSIDRTAFADRLKKASYSSQVHFHVNAEGVSRSFDVASCVASVRADARVYVCGPQGFIEATVKACAAAGWPSDRVHREYFGAVVPQVLDTHREFMVRLGRSGKSVPVTPNQTILEALCAHGFEVPSSCGAGVCGTCLTTVLEGVPDHRDVYQTEAEQALNRQIAVCCSRSKSSVLVLDL